MAAVAIDFEAEGLLKGLRGKAREARCKLLEQLASEGVSLEELKRAVAEDRLAILPVERVLAGEGEAYSALEVAETAGVEVEFLERMQQALGLPVPGREEAIYGEDDVKAAHLAKLFRDAGLPEPDMLEVARVIGMNMAQLAAANRALFFKALMSPGDTERDVGLRFAAAAEQMMPPVGELLLYALGRHQREQVRQDTIAHADVKAGGMPGSAEIAVCFCDMVGFTKLGEQLPPEELGFVAGRLGELAGEVARQPVRLIKLIGDAAMLVSPDPGALLEAALDLVEAAEGEGEGFPSLHAGIAMGAALNRGGDWYGRPVNLASRITSIALPASVLVSEEVHETIDGDYRWSRTSPKRLKGVEGSARLYRARRLTDRTAA
jgi:adenylate cyclase